AWQILRKEFPEHKLVLVGREDFFWKQLKTTSYILHPTSSIIFYGSATDEELATLYKNAALLVQPSLEEGFSLSPLEAISFGCPAAVSDIPIHHEILKDAALFFNPLDPYSIAETIKTILNDSSSKIRLKTQSTALLSGYSWKSHAHTTRDLYESIYKV
ncbi:MAG: glycosyltransferase, partial [bacterium]|nr:glycosyltransferase [bacterium]